MSNAWDMLAKYFEDYGFVYSLHVGKNNEIIYSTHGHGFSIYDGESFKNYNETN